MLKKGSKLNSILTGSCPRCHSESMYVAKNPYTFGKTLKMNDHCSHCGLKYHMEPSFFFGAMYVSYAVNVALGIVVFLIANLVFHTGMLSAFVCIFIVLVVLMPIILRWSRTLYINMFVSYDPSAGK